jgi:hypothetical protein
VNFPLNANRKIQVVIIDSTKQNYVMKSDNELFFIIIKWESKFLPVVKDMYLSCVDIWQMIGPNRLVLLNNFLNV